MSANEPSAAYLEIEAQRTAHSDQLFELMVKDAWYSAFASCFRDFSSPMPGARGYVYYDEPRLSSEDGRCYLGGQVLLDEARAYKARTLDLELDDDQFKLLVEEVLHDELEKHSIVLQWCTRHDLEGTDRVLLMFHKSEEIPPAT